MENPTQFANTQTVSFLKTKLSFHPAAIQLYFTTISNTQIVAVLFLFDDHNLRRGEQSSNTYVAVTGAADAGRCFIEPDTPRVALLE